MNMSQAVPLAADDVAPAATGERSIEWLGVVALLALAGAQLLGILGSPPDRDMGHLQKIMYVHVPAAWNAFIAYFVVAIASLLYLWKGQERHDLLAASAAEVGAMLTALTLVLGSIWGRPTWGIWWTWDARLTWAFITCLIYAGYLMMRNAIDEPSARARYASVLCIFAFTSVVITFKAIEWWRTQHPGPVLSIRSGGGRMDPAMESILYQNWFALLMIAAVMVAVRMRQEGVLREVESLRRRVHAA